MGVGRGDRLQHGGWRDCVNGHTRGSGARGGWQPLSSGNGGDRGNRRGKLGIAGGRGRWE